MSAFAKEVNEHSILYGVIADCVGDYCFELKSALKNGFVQGLLDLIKKEGRNNVTIYVDLEIYSGDDKIINNTFYDLYFKYKNDVYLFFREGHSGSFQIIDGKNFYFYSPTLTTFPKFYIKYGVNDITFDLSGLVKLTVLQESWFPDRQRLTKIDLGNVTKIGRSCFAGCLKLKEIDLKNVTEFDSYCFNGCSNLKEIDLSNTTKMGISCFANCTSLIEVKWSIASIKIPEFSFANCTNLQNFLYNEPLPSEDDYCFLGVKTLLKINLDENKSEEFHSKTGGGRHAKNTISKKKSMKKDGSIKKSIKKAKKKSMKKTERKSGKVGSVKKGKGREVSKK